MAKREHLLKVCKAIIDNPLRIDGDAEFRADAVAAFKSAALRYAGDREALKNLYQNESEVGVAVRKAFDVLDDAMETRKARDDQNFRSTATGAIYPKGDRWYLDEVADPYDIDEREDDDDDEDDDVEKQTDHHASVVANLLVEAGSFGSRSEALHHLLHKPAGQGLLARLKKAADQTAKDAPMESSIAKIIKEAGFIAVAKAIADGRSYGLSEEEFVQFATEDAVKKFPDKTPDAAFTRMFTDGGSDGLVLRRAHAVVRAEQLYGPTYAKADRSEGKAYGELMSKAEEYRSAHPELSISQCFEKVYCAPANVELAKRERVESAPR